MQSNNSRFFSYLLFIVISISVVGCAGSPARREADNTKNMLGLKPDMAIEQVTKLMGAPNKTEMYRGKNGEVVLTYLYLTNAFGSIRNPENEANFTPLIFVDDRLSGWGWNQLDTVAERYELIIKNR